jgi:3-phosphoshikimate 1-carboxyvinyltransferase
MIKKISPSSTLRGEITPPGDKSISHRAILLNSIAQGKARLTNFCPGADCGSTLTCLQALGVGIKQASAAPLTIEIDGVGKKGLREAEDVLNAGNSATTMRLLTGLLASQPFLSIITGDSSLRSRPMGRLISPLRLMGAKIWGRGEDSLAPLAIRGGELHGITYPLPVPSAQLKSALLIAALFAEGETTIQEPSKSRDHTERLLQAMGVPLKVDATTISLTSPLTPLNPIDLHIPGDISSAAYWLVIGAIHPDAKIRVKDTGVNSTRMGIIEVLLKMGAKIKIENQRWAKGEPVADLSIESSELAGIEIGGELIPQLIDEIPVIAVAACVARGVTVIKNAAELRVKETDRISNLVKELSKLGATMEELSDGMAIHGGAKLHGTKCSSHSDHRLAMALGVAGLIAEGKTVIEDAEAVKFSYPAFWQDVERIKAN